MYSYCFNFSTGNCSAQSIKPVNETQLHAFKDETVIISYTYDKANYLFWYRQYPGSRPEYLLRIYPKEGATSEPNPLFPQFSSTVDHTNSVVNLIISSTAVSDSALYYCALEPTVTETHQTLTRIPDFSH
uniref:Immunoglobulin V-set domain-containing protein n=1 Tax=Astyanax mexicanus TaxID=7994 RepID=A0A3B1IXM8_ASTMX